MYKIFWVVIFCLIPFAPSWGCSCLRPPELTKSYFAADAIFTGKVVDIDKSGAEGLIKVTFVVDENLKRNQLTVTQHVYTQANESACGYPFVVDSSYLVFASVAADDSVFLKAGELGATLCGRTVNLESDRISRPGEASLLLNYLRDFRVNPPAVITTPCDDLDCRINMDEYAVAENLILLAKRSPLQAFNKASEINNQCLRMHARRNVAELWAQSASSEFFEYVDGDFDRYLLCGYEYNIESGLRELSPEYALSWLERNTDPTYFPVVDPITGLDQSKFDTDSPKRIPYSEPFARWLEKDFDTAMKWYKSNAEKIHDGVFLTVTVFNNAPELFLAKLYSLPEQAMVREVIGTIASLELYQEQSSRPFVSALTDPLAVEWGNALVDAIHGLLPAENMLDKTASYFGSGKRSGAPSELYQVIQYLSWEKVPRSVRVWIDETPHLNEFARGDLHALLDSRSR